MSEKDRFKGRAFTCTNRRFRTNVQKGWPHSDGQAMGSVFDQPLARIGKQTLWLEHAISKPDGNELVWFMWYDEMGSPTTPTSVAFPESELEGMSRQLSTVRQAA
jgi:hypothetical protein